MISEIDQPTLDFDWFFTDGDNIGYVASGGGKLPTSISAKTLEEIKLVFSFFENLPETSSIQINADLNKIIDSAVDGDYLRDFAFMTKRGLYSFDRTVLNHFADTRYHLVAKPNTPLRLDQLPLEMREVILLSKFDGSLDMIAIDSTLVS